MEDNNNPIYIIDNQNEKNIDQILDINTDNFSEKYIDFDSSQRLKQIDIINFNPPLKEEKKSKVYVRILRNIIKKKDNLRKNIIQNLFTKWKKETLKGLTIKKTIIVRISVSKEKEQKNKNFLDIDREKDKSKSANKLDFKSLNKNHNISRNVNIKRYDSKDSKENLQKSIDNVNNNLMYYEVAKKIKNYKGKTDTNVNNNKLLNITDSNIISPSIKLDEINIDKSITIPKNNYNDKFKNIYPANKVNNHFIETRHYSKKNNIINNIDYVNTEPNNYKNETTSIPILNSDYVNINVSSSNNNVKNDNQFNNSINNINHIINYNKPKISNILNDINISKGFHTKYEGYNHNSIINTSLPSKDVHIDSSNIEAKLKEYNSYEPKTNIIYRRYIPKKNNIIDINNTHYNSYKNKSYQVNKNKKVYDSTNYMNNIININNQNEISGKSPMKESYSLYSQKTANPALKSGVTTVIQHYSGRRKQYNQYDQKTYKIHK